VENGEPRLLGRRVFVTGHTGFKGSWLCLWLQRTGRDVSGYALRPAPPACSRPPTWPGHATHTQGDIRDLAALRRPGPGATGDRAAPGGPGPGAALYENRWTPSPPM
jgi:nucleoside-diphosphate-sugar epimerase